MSFGVNNKIRLCLKNKDRRFSAPSPYHLCANISPFFFFFLELLRRVFDCNDGALMLTGVFFLFYISKNVVILENIHRTDVFFPGDGGGKNRFLIIRILSHSYQLSNAIKH